MSNNQVKWSCSVCSLNGRYSVMISFQTHHRYFVDDVQRNFHKQSLLPIEAVGMVNDDANDIEIDAETNISENLEYNYCCGVSTVIMTAQFCLLRKNFVSKFDEVLTLNYHCYLYCFGSGKLYDWDQILRSSSTVCARLTNTTVYVDGGFRK
ncbi:hypothetical protein PHYBLDRAFT_163926 [Phycomyces blakesleeanus NRRL 1555(-)]|uniref:Uncharacterized protein n=1 Tax=Phycomyces blakesleeanus (strain ATCC 8743b / DSM 1359 / FGSC 10004 / NBRC 33097 / NRRL 1555) TaxID=763407 RepID=A0A167PZR7_PHYB8|nr:hypothetical protein PHYBLDRAFT_163926 [Phycomyces blakesleeanus NRRL 1555(-)]OAD78834.1 hypothetical protein PHYBLDRAFT_163926 [Phycomyces blakesleeanus NRRL 1555(-)]|eukprot:XP_018296874.1 hypothetical protein PHYBLDRAFT_163926 [Phycomyces blakesleeanus NRRL 1555(-)]